MLPSLQRAGTKSKPLFFTTCQRQNMYLRKKKDYLKILLSSFLLLELCLDSTPFKEGINNTFWSAFEHIFGLILQVDTLLNLKNLIRNNTYSADCLTDT